LSLRIGRYSKNITASRAVGTLVFGAFGILFIALAVTGNAETAPGFQRSLGVWVGHLAHRLDSMPNVIAWPIVGLVIGVLVYLVIKPLKPEEETP
jgi:hypothetical protein